MLNSSTPKVQSTSIVLLPSRYSQLTQEIAATETIIDLQILRRLTTTPNVYPLPHGVTERLGYISDPVMLSVAKHLPRPDILPASLCNVGPLGACG